MGRCRFAIVIAPAPPLRASQPTRLQFASRNTESAKLRFGTLISRLLLCPCVGGGRAHPSTRVSCRWYTSAEDRPWGTWRERFMQSSSCSALGTTRETSSPDPDNNWPRLYRSLCQSVDSPRRNKPLPRSLSVVADEELMLSMTVAVVPTACQTSRPRSWEVSSAFFALQSANGSESRLRKRRGQPRLEGRACALLLAKGAF